MVFAFKQASLACGADGVRVSIILQYVYTGGLDWLRRWLKQAGTIFKDIQKSIKLMPAVAAQTIYLS